MKIKNFKRILLIEIMFFSLILFIPFSKFAYANIEISGEDDNKEEEEDNPDFELFDALNYTFSRLSVFEGILIGAGGVGLFLCIIILIWRYGQYPIVYVQKDKIYEAKKLGRFLEQRKSDKLPEYWILRFKADTKGVREYYCTEGWDDINQRVFNKWYIVYEELPHYIAGVLKLGESDQFLDKVLEDSLGNKIKWVLYRFICLIIWNKWIVNKAFEMVKYIDSDNLVKEVKLLQLEYMMDEITTICDISYEKEIVDKKKGKIKKSFEEKKVPTFRIDDLKRNVEVVKDSIEVSNFDVITTKIHDIKDAINNRKSINEIRSIMELKIRRINYEYIELNTKYNQAREELRTSERKHLTKLQDALERIENESALSLDNLASYTAKLKGLINSGANIKDAVNSAVKEFLHEKQSKKNGELLIKIAQLESQKKALENTNIRLWNQVGNNSGLNKLKINLSDNIDQK